MEDLGDDLGVTVYVYPLTHQIVRETGDLLWRTLDRVNDFCREQGAEDTGRGLSKEIMAAQMMEYPTTLLWVGTDDDLKLLGHAITTIRERDTRRWVEVTQLERLGKIPEEQIVEAFAEIEKWGASFGCDQVRLATLCTINGGKVVSSRGRLFEMKYGFKPWRLLMKKEIVNVPDE